VENLRSLGKTIVLTTHYLDEAEYLADRVAILLDGASRSSAPLGKSPNLRNCLPKFRLVCPCPT